MKMIVYKTDTGIAVIAPTEFGLAIFGIEGIVQKDMPRILPADKQPLWNEGKMSREEYSTYPLPEYKIIDESELPQDETYRNAWNYDLEIDAEKKAETDAKNTEIEEQATLPALVKHLIEQVAALEAQ